MIFSLVAMTGLEKCCITSAYLQRLCHSGERPVARGPLVFGSGKEVKNRFSRWLPWRPYWVSDWIDFSYFWIRSPWYSLPSFESIGLSIQEKKQKIDFQEGCHGAHLGFPILKILAIFDLQVTWCFLPNLESIGLLAQEKKRKIDCHCGHFGLPIGTNLATFNLQVTPVLPSKFWVNWPFSSGEEAKNRFSRWPCWQPSWISDWNDFSYFWSQVTPMFLTKFRVIWPFSSGEAKNRFSRWLPWWPSWISYRNNFRYFCSIIHPKASSQISSHLAFRFRRSKNRFSGHLEFPIGTVLAIFDLQVTPMLPTKFWVNWPRDVGGVGF